MAESDGQESLEVRENLRFQRGEWIVQRIGWAVMVALVVAALVGVFGRGPASATTALDPSGRLEVEYERFGRLESRSDLRIRIDRALFDEQEARIWIDHELIDHQQVTQITPEPQSVISGKSGYTIVLAVDPGDAQAKAVVHLIPLKPGQYSGRIGVPGGPDVSMTQFVYP